MAKKLVTSREPESPPSQQMVPRSDLADWSRERERIRVAHDVEERQRVIEEPIFEREIAERMAAEAAPRIIPNRRHVREDDRRLWVKLLNQQPELQLREIKQADRLLTVIRDNLPPHLAPLLADYATILNFRFTAHESAAFLVGLATGRRLEQQHMDARGRILRGTAKSRREDSLRLHSGD
jgi:hypothetical protein